MSPLAKPSAAVAEGPSELRFPWSWYLCWTVAVANFVAMVTTLIAFPIGDPWPAANPVELEQNRLAFPMLLPAIILEACFLLSYAGGVQQFSGPRPWTGPMLHGFVDSLLTLAEYAAKLLTCFTIWTFDGGPLHTDQFAENGPRAIYFVRFAQWSLAVPILILISNRAFVMDIGSTKVLMQRSAPALIGTFMYVWASWLGLVTTSWYARWILLGLSFAGAYVCAIDQVVLALQRPDVSHRMSKVAMVAFQVATTTFYGAVFLLGIFGKISSPTENQIYTYSDVSIKVVQAAMLAMLRYNEDLATISHWWQEAVARHEDVQRLVQRANVPILEMDMEGNLTGWNESMAELIGIRSEEAMGHPIFEYLLEESREVSEAALSLLRGGEPASGIVELMMMRHATDTPSGKQGRTSPLTLLLKFVMQTRGDQRTICVIGQDLTEVVSLKAVEERKAQFMAVVSHELRSPLHGLIGLSGMLIESECDVPRRRQLSMIRSCSTRLLDLVTNIMDLTASTRQPHEGHSEPLQPARIQAVNFAEIIDEVCVMAQMALDRAGNPLISPQVRLLNEVGSGPVPVVAGDPYKCTQLVYNMVTNACKFTSSGHVRVWAEHRREEGRLEISVTDTGKGISEVALQRIFLPFEQEDNSDNRQFQGIGLGLSVCTEIVRLHRGDLRVRSRLGEGSTFTASFPCDSDNLVGVSTLKACLPLGLQQSPGNRADVPSVNQDLYTTTSEAHGFEVAAVGAAVRHAGSGHVSTALAKPSSEACATRDAAVQSGSELHWQCVRCGCTAGVDSEPDSEDDMPTLVPNSSLPPPPTEHVGDHTQQSGDALGPSLRANSLTDLARSSAEQPNASLLSWQEDPSKPVSWPRGPATMPSTSLSQDSNIPVSQNHVPEHHLEAATQAAQAAALLQHFQSLERRDPRRSAPGMGPGDWLGAWGLGALAEASQTGQAMVAHLMASPPVPQAPSRPFPQGLSSKPLQALQPQSLQPLQPWSGGPWPGSTALAELSAYISRGQQKLPTVPLHRAFSPQYPPSNWAGASMVTLPLVQGGTCDPCLPRDWGDRCLGAASWRSFH